METVTTLFALMAFCFLMLLINLKAGAGSHWSSRLLNFGSFWLLIAAIGALVWKIVAVL